MTHEAFDRDQQASADAGGPPPDSAGWWLARAFPWHLRVFLAVNIALSVVNVFLGDHWWAFWPLATTGLVFGVHYLFYKAAAVDERWVEGRVEELNLKSYDRSHIEDLKQRHGGKGLPRVDYRA